MSVRGVATVVLQLFAFRVVDMVLTGLPQRIQDGEISAAVLLVEVVRSESSMDTAERTTMVTALRGKFALADDELERLLELAHETARTAYDYQRFTGLMNERFSQEEKISVVEAMWEVAFADQHLDANEHHVISKVAGLLHVTHGEYIAAKMHARQTVLGNVD